MESLDIRPCSSAELASALNIADLLQEYGEESAIAALGKPESSPEVYEAMESSGLLHILGAFIGDTLVGFITIVVSVLPHYSKRVGTSESFFVARAHRKRGVGLKLIAEAKRLAHDLGALGLFISAPVGSQLAAVLSELECEETNRVFLFDLRGGV